MPPENQIFIIQATNKNIHFSSIHAYYESGEPDAELRIGEEPLYPAKEMGIDNFCNQIVELLKALAEERNIK